METTLTGDVPDPRRWWALALLCAAFFMVLLDGTIVLVALPSIGADVGFSAHGLQWVLSAYALTFGGLLLLGGRAADLLGRRRLFIAGVGLFTVASLMCGLARSAAALLAARVVQGIGASIMTPTALSIISTTFPDGSERNKALGIWGALGGIGATAAWLIGGPLVDGPGWQWIFFINIPLGLAALALSPVLLRESRAALIQRSYDPAGALTITGALVLLVAGPGIGLAFVTATVARFAGLAEHEAGLASGLSNTATQIRGALGVAMVTTVAITSSEDYLAANAGGNPLVVLNEGFRSAFLALVVLAAIGMALAVLLPGRTRNAGQEHLQSAPATCLEHQA